MQFEMWAIEGKATPLLDPHAPRQVFDLRHNHKDARERAHQLRGLGYKVFAWNMAGSGQFILNK